MQTRLFFVQLKCRDWAASVAWYADILGLPVLLRVDKDRFALLEAGGVRLALNEGRPDPGSTLLTFEVDDLPTWLAFLTEKGVALDGPVKTSPEGYQRVRLRDPDGHALALFAWVRRDPT